MLDEPRHSYGTISLCLKHIDGPAGALRMHGMRGCMRGWHGPHWRSQRGAQHVGSSSRPQRRAASTAANFAAGTTAAAAASNARASNAEGDRHMAGSYGCIQEPARLSVLQLCQGCSTHSKARVAQMIGLDVEAGTALGPAKQCHGLQLHKHAHCASPCKQRFHSPRPLLRHGRRTPCSL